MFPGAWAITRKDLQLVLQGGSGLAQPVLLGLLLVFLFSLSVPVGTIPSPQAAAAVFWLASAFGLVLIFNSLYGLEETDDAHLALVIAPIPLQSVWLGKSAAGFLLLLMTQAVFIPAVLVFLGQDLQGPLLPSFGFLLLVDWGVAAVGGLLGALGQGSSARDSLLTIILFPLLVPLLLGGIRVGAAAFSGPGEEVGPWFQIAGAFDAIFSGAALVLFPFLYRER